MNGGIVDYSVQPHPQLNAWRRRRSGNGLLMIRLGHLDDTLKSWPPLAGARCG